MNAFAVISLAVAAAAAWRAGSHRGRGHTALLWTAPVSRTGRRLRRAMLPVDCAGWRWWGICATAAGSACLSFGGTQPIMAALTASSVVRCTGAAVLWVRAGRLRADCEAGQAEMTRLVATELATGCTVSEAMLRIAGRPAQSHAVAAVATRTAAALRLGADLDVALRAGLECCAADAEGARLLRQSLAVVAFAGAGGAAGAATLRRYADGVEADRRSRRQALAAATEARFVAFALPVLTIVMSAVITGVSPRAAAAVTSPLGMMVCAAGLAIGFAGATLVLLATRP